jgi:hypothetical protein
MHSSQRSGWVSRRPSVSQVRGVRRPGGTVNAARISAIRLVGPIGRVVADGTDVGGVDVVC